MRLNVAVLNTTSQKSSAYLAWVKQHFVAGDAVIVGLYNNVNILGENSPGDSNYDHIVPVMRVGSQQPLTGSDAANYYSSDTITISDNGLYTPFQTNVPGNTSNNPTASALYTYQFGTFQKTRSQANRGSSASDLYSLRNSPSDFAAAITGISDTTSGGPVTIPVSLTSSLDGEGFQDQEFLHAAPSATSMTLTATVQIPDQSKEYTVYRYTDFGSVPTSGFNAAAGQAAQQWTIPAHSGATWSVPVSTDSGTTQVFRAVPTASP